MGVSGSGKTTVGMRLAQMLKMPFIDGDDYHTTANRQKMAEGKPLNDIDRKGWLKTLHEVLMNNKNTGCVMACSALKASYRQKLSKNTRSIFVFLKASYDDILKRMEKRQDHFMPTSLLASQFKTLEEPKNAIRVDATQTAETICMQIIDQINEL